MGLFGIPLDQCHPRPAGHPARAVARQAGFTAIDQSAAEVLPRQRDDVVVVDVAGHGQDHALRGVPANVKERNWFRVIAETESTLPITGRPTGWSPNIVVRKASPRLSSGSSSRMAISSSTTSRSSSTSADAHTVEHDIGHQVHGHLQVVIEHMRVVAGVCSRR